MTEPRARGDRDCSLCTTEKVNIDRGDPEVLLNRRSEIMKKCIHKDKLMLQQNDQEAPQRKNDLDSISKHLKISFFFFLLACLKWNKMLNAGYTHKK